MSKLFSHCFILALLFSNAVFGQSRESVNAEYQKERARLDKTITDSEAFIKKYQPELDRNKAYVIEKEKEHNRWREVIDKCNSGQRQCTADDMKNFTQAKIDSWNEKVRAQTKVVEDLETKISNEKIKVWSARASLAGKWAGNKYDNYNADREIEHLKAVTNGLQAEDSMQKFHDDTKGLLQRFQLLEARFQNTALGGYVHLKLQKLLSKDVMCKAVETCSKSGDPQDLAKKLLYSESVESAAGKIKDSGGNGLQ